MDQQEHRIQLTADDGQILQHREADRNRPASRCPAQATGAELQGEVLCYREGAAAGRAAAGPGLRAGLRAFRRGRDCAGRRSGTDQTDLVEAGPETGDKDGGID